MLERFKEAPRRQQFAAIAGSVVLALFVWAVREKGLFEGLTFLIASVSLLGLVQVLPARPKLRVTARDNDRSHLMVQPVIRPLDENAIAKEQVSTALSEMPSQPNPLGVGFRGRKCAARTIRAHGRLHGGGLE